MLIPKIFKVQGNSQREGDKQGFRFEERGKGIADPKLDLSKFHAKQDQDSLIRETIKQFPNFAAGSGIGASYVLEPDTKHKIKHLIFYGMNIHASDDYYKRFINKYFGANSKKADQWMINIYKESQQSTKNGFTHVINYLKKIYEHLDLYFSMGLSLEGLSSLDFARSHESYINSINRGGNKGALVNKELKLQYSQSSIAENRKIINQYQNQINQLKACSKTNYRKIKELETEIQYLQKDIEYEQESIYDCKNQAKKIRKRIRESNLGEESYLKDVFYAELLKKGLVSGLYPAEKPYYQYPSFVSVLSELEQDTAFLEEVRLKFSGKFFTREKARLQNAKKALIKNPNLEPSEEQIKIYQLARVYASKKSHKSSKLSKLREKYHSEREEYFLNLIKDQSKSFYLLGYGAGHLNGFLENIIKHNNKNPKNAIAMLAFEPSVYKIFRQESYA